MPAPWNRYRLHKVKITEISKAFWLWHWLLASSKGQDGLYILPLVLLLNWLHSCYFSSLGPCSLCWRYGKCTDLCKNLIEPEMILRKNNRNSILKMEASKFHGTPQILIVWNLKIAMDWVWEMESFTWMTSLFKYSEDHCTILDFLKSIGIKGMPVVTVYLIAYQLR